MAAKAKKLGKPTLLTKTIELLQNRSVQLTLDRVAEDCDVTASWLSLLLSKTPPAEAGVNKVQRLYEYLSGKPLEL